jgi:hypothetical protein
LYSRGNFFRPHISQSGKAATKGIDHGLHGFHGLRRFFNAKSPGAKTQPQPKNMNRRKQRKQRSENFAENAEFSGIALQRFPILFRGFFKFFVVHPALVAAGRAARSGPFDGWGGSTGASPCLAFFWRFEQRRS